MKVRRAGDTKRGYDIIEMIDHIRALTEAEVII